MNTGSDLLVTIAWYSAILASLVAILMMSVVLVHRGWVVRARRIEAQVVATWRPILTRAAIDGEVADSLPAISWRRRHYLLDEWNAMHAAVRGQSAEALNGLALRLELNTLAREFLGSRRAGRRILAIRTLGHLCDSGAWKSLQEQLVGPNSLVAFYAAAALVSIDARRAMPGIMLQLSERESWPGEALARLLVDAEAEVSHGPIRAMMLSLEAARIPPLLPWLARVDAMFASQMAIELMQLHPGNDEIISEALLIVQDPQMLPTLCALVDSPDATLRNRLAMLLERLGQEADVPLLVRLMCDPVWWVRYQAARAMVSILRGSATRLDELRETLTDTYARDMLEHVRAELALA